MKIIILVIIMMMVIIIIDDHNPQLATFYWQHFHMYSFATITSNEPVCFEGWNKFWVPVWSPLDPNLIRRWKFSFTEGESDFLPLPVFFFEVSSAIDDITLVLVIIHFPWARPVINQLWYLECHGMSGMFLCGSLGSPKEESLLTDCIILIIILNR